MSNRLFRSRAAFGALIIAAAPLSAQSPRTEMPDSVRTYVRDAMIAFRTKSVHRSEVDWPALEDSVFARSAGANTPAETWRALTWALRSVDPHSLLQPSPAMMAAMTGGMVPPVVTSQRAAAALPASASADLLMTAERGRATRRFDARQPGYGISRRAQRVHEEIGVSDYGYSNITSVRTLSPLNALIFRNPLRAGVPQLSGLLNALTGGINARLLVTTYGRCNRIHQIEYRVMNGSMKERTVPQTPAVKCLFIGIFRQRSTSRRSSQRLIQRFKLARAIHGNR